MNRRCVMCELVKLRRHMKVYEKELTEAHHDVTKATLQWN